MALDRLVGDRVDVDGAVGAGVLAARVARALVVVDLDRAARALVQRAAGTRLDAGRVLAVLTGHRRHDPRHRAAGTLVVVVDGLADVVPERHVVLRLARDLTGVAPEALARVDDPAVLLAVVGSGDAVPPVLLGHEEILANPVARLGRGLGTGRAEAGGARSREALLQDVPTIGILGPVHLTLSRIRHLLVPTSPPEPSWRTDEGGADESVEVEGASGPRSGTSSARFGHAATPGTRQPNPARPGASARGALARSALFMIELCGNAPPSSRNEQRDARTYMRLTFRPISVLRLVLHCESVSPASPAGPRDPGAGAAGVGISPRARSPAPGPPPACPHERRTRRRSPDR